MSKRLPTVALFVSLCVPIAAQAPTEPETHPAWKLQDAIGEESWLKLSGSLRLRYEGISGQFRAAPRLDNSDHLFFQRTIVRADADLDRAGLTLEILDGRHYGGGFGSAINNSSINTVDFLQGYGEYDLGGLAGGNHSIRAGRQTMDYGGRRLSARNGYRNTINAFTGARWSWQDEESSLDVFWTLPVERLPRDLNSVVDNDVELDEQDIDQQFYGAFYQEQLGGGDLLDLYVFVIDENELRRRRLVSPGARWLRPRKRGHYDYEFEGIYQFGDSRLAASSGQDLDHSAWFTHGHVGYTLDDDWQTNFRLAFDYASGDDDPTDGDNGRFDTLFGARRWEFGPTGILGLVARSNLLSPALHVTFKPRKDVEVMTSWRGIWLASDNDILLAAGVQDPTGASGRHVGQQFEIRSRWDMNQRTVRLEAGLAYIFDGEFQRSAPGGQSTDTTYGYMQFRWLF